MKISTTSARLEEIMKEKDLRQIDVIELCKPFWTNKIKIQKNDLNQYLKKGIQPSQEKLSVLAQGLNVDEAWLLGYEVPRKYTYNEIIKLIDNYADDCDLKEIKNHVEKKIKDKER